MLAVILFAHGARDTRWSLTLTELEARVRARLPGAWVQAAFLEFQPPTLAAALADARAAGATRIALMPVFWASGGHVAHELPLQLEAFRCEHPDLALTVLPVISELPGLLDFIADAVAEQA